MDLSSFAKLFDHSIVRPDATQADVVQVAETAARLGTATLTVQPHYIRLAVEQLRGSGVLVGTVVGFPHDNETASMKAYQAREVLELGADELMYRAVAGRCRVKAAGGIREIQEVLQYLQAGARRFGSTRTDQLVRAFQQLPVEQRQAFEEYLPSPSPARR